MPHPVNLLISREILSTFPQYDKDVLSSMAEMKSPEKLVADTRHVRQKLISSNCVPRAYCVGGDRERKGDVAE